jgi:hypothetical protein
MNWKPIETAPRDGTPFLAWDGDMFVAYYRPGGKILIDQQRDDWSRYRPEFWHPLPPPPTVNESFTVPTDNEP